jgi:hypothetical protein
MTAQILHGFQVHPDKTLVGCAAQDSLIGTPAAVLGTFWPMQQTQGGITRYLDFPLALADGLWKRNQLYCQTWSAMDLTAGKSWLTADVLSGKHNTYLHRQAKLLAAWGHPFFVRLDHEFSWKGSPFYMSGADFTALWRYIVGLFRADGATNVTWVWCPNQISVGQDLAAWYPGDAWVDWTAVDTYNWPPPSTWQTFPHTLQVSYDALLRIAPLKPIMLAEWASDDRGGDKVAWLLAALAALPLQFPAVRAFLYYPCITATEHWPLAVADGTVVAYTTGLRLGPYPVVGSYPMPPDLQPIRPLTSVVAWGDPLADLANARLQATATALQAAAALSAVTADLAAARALAVTLAAADAVTADAVAAQLAAATAQIATAQTAVLDLFAAVGVNLPLQGPTTP